MCPESSKLDFGQCLGTYVLVILGGPGPRPGIWPYEFGGTGTACRKTDLSGNWDRIPGFRSKQLKTRSRDIGISIKHAYLLMKHISYLGHFGEAWHAIWSGCGGEVVFKVAQP